uniref:Helitron helicase-like domain-containing protein n=1 Tax=Octopus bimaculoides TaxID=37653 RepID=A0A0L8GHT5_OCTBM
MQVHLHNFHLCQNFRSLTSITDKLYPGQTPADRPDLTDRVFNMKLRDLLDDILEKNVLGEVAGYMWTIEFQKCGLPHCHMLFILQKDPEYYDKFVYAELPNLQTQPILFQHVTKNMLHGPCRRDKPNATCMVDGKCKKHFPKVFQENTLHSYNGYPLYQCRNNGFTFTKSNVELDNCSVVPYSPFFLVKYRGHCNVEICASVKSVKYISKYIHKGHDWVTVNISGQTNAQQTHKDEIENYINGCYVFSSEAVWRILGFKLHGSHPAVQQLTVHLPKEQYIYFNDDDDIEHVIHTHDRSTHTEWMRVKWKSPANSFAYTLHYTDFPEFYTWNNSEKM